MAEEVVGPDVLDRICPMMMRWSNFLESLNLSFQYTFLQAPCSPTITDKGCSRGYTRLLQSHSPRPNWIGSVTTVAFEILFATARSTPFLSHAISPTNMARSTSEPVSIRSRACRRIVHGTKSQEGHCQISVLGRTVMPRKLILLSPPRTDKYLVLKYFPTELWSTLDPRGKSLEWQASGSLLPESSLPKSKTKRKRLEYTDGEDVEEDVVISGSRRKRVVTRDDPTRRPGQKEGLEAEDQYGPEAEEIEDDAEGPEEAFEDSDFEESDDGGNDDYNAENYFQGGGDEDNEDGGGGGEDGINF